MAFRNMLGLLLAVVLMTTAAVAVGCSGDDDNGDNGSGPTAEAEPDPEADPEPSGTEEPLEGDLVVYSGRREPLLQPVIEAFEEESGIEVAVKYGATNELGNALIEEKGDPRADVFVGTDAASAESLCAILHELSV